MDEQRKVNIYRIWEQHFQIYGARKIWRQKGFTEAILGRHQEGIKSMEKSLELGPRQGKLWAALIDTYRHAGRDKDVKSAYEKLRGIDSEWAEKVYQSAILPFEEFHP